MDKTKLKYKNIPVLEDVYKQVEELANSWDIKGLGKAVLYMVSYFRITGINPTEDKFDTGFDRLLRKDNYLIGMLKEHEKIENTKHIQLLHLLKEIQIGIEKILLTNKK